MHVAETWSTVGSSCYFKIPTYQ